MRATYRSHQNCQACLDLGWIETLDMAQICAACNKEHTHTVTILQLGVGFFGNKAIVKDVDTGKLNTVYLSDLTIIEEETNEP